MSFSPIQLRGYAVRTQSLPAPRPAARGRAPEPVRLPLGEQKSGAPVVLVAKALTDSDAKTGRVILPRAMVENNLLWFCSSYRCVPWRFHYVPR